MAAPLPSRRLDVTTLKDVSLALVTACIVIGALALGRDLLAPLSLAVLMALALAPLVRWLARVLPRSLAAALVVVSLAAVTAGTAYSITDDAVAVIDRMPVVARDLRKAVDAAARQRGVLAQMRRALAELQQISTDAAAGPPATVAIAPPPIDLTRGLLMGTRDALAAAGQGVLLLFLVFFLLSTGDLMKTKLVRLSGPQLSRRRVTVQMIDQIGDQVGKYVGYLALSGTLVGLLTWLAFAVMGVAYAGLWGVAAGVLNCLPYAGPAIVMVASFMAALAQFQSPGWAAVVALVSLAITSIEGLVLAPVLFGRWCRINPVAVFVAVMFWTWMWGPLGALLALPLLVAIKAVADAVPDFAVASELIAD